MKILKSINSFFTKTTIVLGQATKYLDEETEAMIKRRKISKDKSLQHYKKEKAQMVIDGDYESEEAMDKELERLEAQVLDKK